MDPHDPYVGKQRASVGLRALRPWLRPRRYRLRQRKDTTAAHVLLSGDPGARSQVSLAWGPAPADRQIVVPSRAGSDWQSASVRAHCGADSSDAHLEITGTGSGKFRVGAVSLMPADNINGWRADTTAILATLHSGMWRLPGGNFLSDWDWHSAIGPRDKRAPMFDHAGARCSPTISAWMSTWSSPGSSASSPM